MQPDLEQQIVRLARDCLSRANVALDRVDRIIDLEAHLRRCEEQAGRRADDRMRSRVKGRFAVHFPLPSEPDVCMTPDCVIVEVDLANESAKIVA